jgi:hypothetical protein
VWNDLPVSTPESSYEELAALVGTLTVLLEQANARIAELETQAAALQARVGKNSSNSSVPPSQDSISGKAQAKAGRARQRSQRVRSADRKPGGQPGHQGFGLVATRTPDETVVLAPAADCGHCGADLAGGVDAGSSWAQVWDIPLITLWREHFVLPRRRCGACAKVTTASVPFGAAGTVSYGPNVNAAAVCLGSDGNVPVECTARLMGMLLGSPVSTGFVARAGQRFADLLEAAGFDEAMVAALRAEPVLCADETPVNVAHPDVDAHGARKPGSPHVVIVRSPDGRLMWYHAIAARTKTAIAGLGVFTGYTGVLVRDDFASWHQFDATLAGVQQCAAHLLRHLQGVLDLHPRNQSWAADVQTVLREANTAVQAAAAAGAGSLDPQLLAGLRERYATAVDWGIRINEHRAWPKGNHPGYVLAARLQAKTEQVWLFTRDFAVPWTNNASEQALKSPKLHQKVSGYWHTLTTLARYCRTRSYLTSARNHGLTTIDAIHRVLTGDPWLPAPITA